MHATMVSFSELVTDRDAAARAVISRPGLRIWQFNGLFRHDVTIGALNKRLSSMEVIDQYSGSIPELFSLRRHIAGRIELAVNRSLLLDSNVSRYFRKYLKGTLKDPLQADVRACLTWIAQEGLNVHPGFSIMETVSGGDDPELDGLELVKMALLLSGMDGELFLRNGTVAMGAIGRRFLTDTYGTDDVDAAAASEFARLPKKTREIVDPTYAALLKIALIEASVPYARFSQRLDEFISFLETSLHAILSVEIVTAILFFSGQIGKFIPLRRAAPPEERFSSVRSSAWDLFLARMASAFVGESDETKLSLPLIITSDERLKNIVRAQKLAGVVAFEGKPPYPIVSIDFEFLESVAPKGWTSDSLQNRLAKRDVSARSQSNDMQAIIHDLEEEARRKFGD